MTNRTYYAPHGGLPPQTALLTDRAVFTEAYAVIPKGVLRDITTSYLRSEKARAWVFVASSSGFAELSRNTSWKLPQRVTPEPDNAKAYCL
jgi:(S)-ureidoglycine aminohydrolase